MSFSSDQFAAEGREWFRNALPESSLASLDEWFGEMDGRAGKRRSVASLPDEARSRLTDIAGAVLPGANPVRVVTFDKSAASNWMVPWHRDFVVVVDERANVEGYSNWTQRDCVWHVRPPIDLLDRMLFLRILLDDTSADSGDLEICPGSHLGEERVSAHDPQTETARRAERTTGVRGDVLALHALMLHRSATAKKPNARRAIRIDFCAEDLPEPLKWAA